MLGMKVFTDGKKLVGPVSPLMIKKNRTDCPKFNRYMKKIILVLIVGFSCIFSLDAQITVVMDVPNDAAPCNGEQVCVDVRVKDFLARPLEGDWPYLWLDATYIKVRKDGRIVSVAAIIAVACCRCNIAAAISGA